MTDTALYRKYRPGSFADVLGQDHIVSVLEGALEQDRLAHAYLFVGSRGTGKTSIARILASRAGCLPEDIYEMDAASNTGVDDMRTLIESVQTLPFSSPRKAYILDEAHMLSKSASNALLKTLEEPPAHAMFILATTESAKIPDTIMSRCQTFTFKKPSQEVLRELVIRIAKKEGFTMERSSADLIALLGDGSFRDTQGILQKVISVSADKKISPEEVLRITGAPAMSLVSDFLGAIADGDIERGLSAVRTASAQNTDMRVFLKLILRFARFILLLRFAKDEERRIASETAEPDFAFLKKMSGKDGARISSRALRELISASDAMRYASVPELPLELALIEIIGHNASTEK